MGEEGRGKTTSINSIMIPKHLESGGNGGGNVDGYLLPEDDKVGLLLLSQLGENLGHRQRLQLFVLFSLHCHVDGSVCTHCQCSTKRLLNTHTHTHTELLLPPTHRHG